MNYDIKKLSEVEALTEVPEGANMIAEVGGQIKRVPAVTGEGGGSGGGNNLSDKIYTAETDIQTYIGEMETVQIYNVAGTKFIIQRQLKEGDRVVAKVSADGSFSFGSTTYEGKGNKNIIGTVQYSDRAGLNIYFQDDYQIATGSNLYKMILKTEEDGTMYVQPQLSGEGAHAKGLPGIEVSMGLFCIDKEENIIGIRMYDFRSGETVVLAADNLSATFVPREEFEAIIEDMNNH